MKYGESIKAAEHQARTKPLARARKGKPYMGSPGSLKGHQVGHLGKSWHSNFRKAFGHT
jgi:hypothetical protein